MHRHLLTGEETGMATGKPPTAAADRFGGSA